MDTPNTTTHLAQTASDTAMAKFGATAAVSGGTTSVVSGLTMNTIGIVFGMVIGTLLAVARISIYAPLRWLSAAFWPPPAVPNSPPAVCRSSPRT